MTYTPTVQDDKIVARFDDFGPDSYAAFLRLKSLPEFDIDFDLETFTHTITAPSRFAGMLGLETPQRPATNLPFPDYLFDDQKHIVNSALDSKRYAVWSDCGMGKTFIEAEFARQVAHKTGGRVLIFTMNDIVPQWVEMIEEFYPEGSSHHFKIRRIHSRHEMREWAAGRFGDEQIAITNYEKMNPGKGDQVVNELRHLAGVVLDESSRLKTGGGKQKWALIKSCKGIEYKLSCTATPAPNDWMEFASQASFLERMRSEQDIIWTYFSKNKAGEWTIKKHAREAFFTFLASWSIYVSDPRRFGWRAGWEGVPEPIYLRHEIEAMPEQLEEMRKLTQSADGQLMMFQKDRLSAIDRVKMSEIAKGFIYEGGDAILDADGKPTGKKTKKIARSIPSRKPAFVADLIRQEVAYGHQVLCWTQFDEESAILGRELAKRGVPIITVTGRMKKSDRPEAIARFKRGDVPVLVGRPKMLGYGQNFQMATSMVFNGWNDSFEEMYQAIRRAFRYGQLHRVRVHFPVIPELEGDSLENIHAKEANHKAAVEAMELAYIKASQILKGTAA